MEVFVRANQASLFFFVFCRLKLHSVLLFFIALVLQEAVVNVCARMFVHSTSLCKSTEHFFLLLEVGL